MEILLNTTRRPSCPSEKARRVAFVDKDHGAVLVSQLPNLFEWSNVSVHGEDSVRNNQPLTGIPALLKLLFQI